MKRFLAVLILISQIAAVPTAFADGSGQDTYKRYARDPRTGKMVSWDIRYENCPIQSRTRASSISGMYKTSGDIVRATGGTTRRKSADYNPHYYSDPARYNYGNSEGQEGMFRWLRRYAYHHRSSGKCARFVRNALEAAGWWRCGQGIGLRPQTDAAANLRANGFTKIRISRPSQAPVGAVLIYQGICSTRVDKNSRYGHIEIRTPEGFASDFMSQRPISSYNSCRRFKEAWVHTGPTGRVCRR
jgi:hypothetical protein